MATAPQKGADPAWVPKQHGRVPLTQHFSLEGLCRAVYVPLHSASHSLQDQRCLVQSQYHCSGIWPQQRHHPNSLLTDVTDLTTHQTALAQTAVNSCWRPGGWGYSCCIGFRSSWEQWCSKARIISGRNNSSNTHEIGHSKKWGGEKKKRRKSRC